MIEQSLFFALANWAPLAALVGNRISPAQSIERGTQPRVTLHQVTGNYSYTQDGVDANVEDWWQFNSWATDYDSMRAIALEIVAALHAGGSSPVVFHAFVDQRQDFYENDTRIHHGIVVVRIWWLQP